MAECLHLSNDTWGPRHLSFSAHCQIQKVMFRGNEPKAAFTLTEGTRTTIASESHPLIEEWVPGAHQALS